MIQERACENGICKVRVVHTEKIKEARANSPSEKKIDYLSSIFKALGDPSRMKIVFALKDVEMCVCDLAAFLDITESAVSHQLRRLKDLGLVKYRRDGQIYYYTLKDDHVAELLKSALNHMSK